MAVDAFIWFEKASVGSEPGGFEIKDFSFGIENPTTIGSATGGAGAGKIKFNEFTIKKTTDSASPTIFKNCCAGAHYKTVIVEMRKAGGDKMRKAGGDKADAAPAASGKAFLRFKFDTVFTTKVDWSGPGDEGPEESITFVYGKLGIKFIPQEPGSQPVAAGWDQMLNQAAQEFAEG